MLSVAADTEGTAGTPWAGPASPTAGTVTSCSTSVPLERGRCLKNLLVFESCLCKHLPCKSLFMPERGDGQEVLGLFLSAPRGAGMASPAHAAWGFPEAASLPSRLRPPDQLW